MGSFQVTPGDRHRAEGLFDFVKNEYGDMSERAKWVFCIAILRHIDPEVETLRAGVKEELPPEDEPPLFPPQEMNGP